MPANRAETTYANPAVETEQVLAWVKAAQSGSGESFERLADLYYGTIFRMTYFRTKNRMDAEDITQEIFMKAYAGLGNLTDTARFKGWLFQIAVYRVRDFQRRQKFRHLFKPLIDDAGETRQEHDRSTHSGPDEHLRRQRFHREAEKFMTRLSKTEKDVFVLRFFDQLRINEIALALKKRESTVKTHLYRALAKFKHDRGFRNFLKGV